ncbi:MAG TPA: hypothetical protein VF023_00645 [Bryobacteraceae bacterium]
MPATGAPRITVVNELSVSKRKSAPTCDVLLDRELIVRQSCGARPSSAQ